MVVGEYYTTKCKEIGYSEKMQKCIKDACQYCIDNIQDNGNLYNKGEHPLMMFGKIQSGKTRAFTGLMALAFDNKFDYVFILTKNNKALVEQTYKRIKMESLWDSDEVFVYPDKKRVLKYIPGIDEYRYVPITNVTLSKAEIPFLIFERNKGKCFIQKC